MPAGSTAEFPSPMNRTPPRRSSRAKQGCMPRCEVCENEYDKAFEIVVGGQRHTFDSFECRNPRAGACLPALQLPNRRSRRRSGRTNLLLRPLYTRVRQNTGEGPRLKVAVIAVAAVHGCGATGSPCRIANAAAIDLMRLDLPAIAKYRC